MPPVRRPATLLVLSGLLLVGLVVPAMGHVSADKSEVPAGGFTELTFTVPHGCGESPTTELAIQVPDLIFDVTPGIHPGWDVEVTSETLGEPVTDAHGNEITERETVVTWTAQPGNELPHGFRDSFELGFQAPDAAGETLYFKAIQTCVDGETAWISEDPEADEPAPAVTIVASGGGGHGNDADGGTDEPSDPSTPIDAEPAVTDENTGSDTLAIVALAVGGLGLATGGLALARAGGRG